MGLPMAPYPIGLEETANNAVSFLLLFEPSSKRVRR